jgi:hypothetical protein
MKIALAAFGIALSTACIAQTESDARARARECQSKYGSVRPAGASLPMSDPIRISPGQFAPQFAYACVTVTIDESGKIIASQVVETDHAPLAEHLLAQARAAKWRPGMFDGAPIAFTAVVSASYGPSGP